MYLRLTLPGKTGIVYSGCDSERKERSREWKLIKEHRLGRMLKETFARELKRYWRRRQRGRVAGNDCDAGYPRWFLRIYYYYYVYCYAENDRRKYSCYDQHFLTTIIRLILTLKDLFDIEHNKKLFSQRKHYYMPNHCSQKWIYYTSNIRSNHTTTISVFLNYFPFFLLLLLFFALLWL